MPRSASVWYPGGGADVVYNTAWVDRPLPWSRLTRRDLLAHVVLGRGVTGTIFAGSAWGAADGCGTGLIGVTACKSAIRAEGRRGRQQAMVKECSLPFAPSTWQQQHSSGRWQGDGRQLLAVSSPGLAGGGARAQRLLVTEVVACKRANVHALGVPDQRDAASRAAQAVEGAAHQRLVAEAGAGAVLAGGAGRA